MKVKPNDQEKSYNELMNEWSAQQSLFGKMRSKVFHPPHDASLAGKIWGYSWRIGTVFLTTAIVYLYLLNNHTQTRGFRAEVRDAATAWLGGNPTTNKISAVRWNWMSGFLTTKRFYCEGTDTTIFNQLDAYSVFLPMNFGKVFRSEYKIEEMEIGKLVMTLKSGGMGTKPTGTSPGPAPLDGPDAPKDLPAPGELRTEPDAPQDSSPGRSFIPDLKTGSAPRPSNGTLTAGMGMNLKVPWKVAKYNIEKLFLSWGYTENTAGGLFGTQAVIEQDGAGWKIRLAGGTFSQNWLQNLEIESASLRIQSGVLTIETATFIQNKLGKAAMSGTVTLEEVPRANLSVTMNAMRLNELLPKQFADLFDGTVKGGGKITGSVNLSTGIETSFHLEFDGAGTPPSPKTVAALRNVPVLRSIGIVIDDNSLAQLHLTSGSIDFTTSSGDMQISNLSLEAKDKISISGIIKGHQIKRNSIATASQPVATSDDPLDDTESPVPFIQQLMPIAPAGYYTTISGTLDFGLGDSRHAKLPPKIKEMFNKENRDLHWLSIPLDNEKGDDLTKKTADTLTQLHRESLLE